MNSPTLLCFTGGPGAGKTECVSRLATSLRARGLTVFVVPEVATMLITAGAKPWEMTMGEHFLFQVSQVSVQDALEQAALRMSPRSSPVVILCDRGLMDGAAYFGLEEWDEVLAKIGTNREHVLKRRYHAVIHLASSACLSPAVYPGAANPARWQDAAGARESDIRLLEAWAGHPRHHVLHATAAFDEKAAAVDRLVTSLLAAVASE